MYSEVSWGLLEGPKLIFKVWRFCNISSPSQAKVKAQTSSFKSPNINYKYSNFNFQSSKFNPQGSKFIPEIQSYTK